MKKFFVFIPGEISQQFGYFDSESIKILKSKTHEFLKRSLKMRIRTRKLQYLWIQRKIGLPFEIKMLRQHSVQTEMSSCLKYVIIIIKNDCLLSVMSWLLPGISISINSYSVYFKTPYASCDQRNPLGAFIYKLLLQFSHVYFHIYCASSQRGEDWTFATLE